MSVDVQVQLDTAKIRQINLNSEKLRRILKSVILCGQPAKSGSKGTTQMNKL